MSAGLNCSDAGGVEPNSSFWYANTLQELSGAFSSHRFACSLCARQSETTTDLGHPGMHLFPDGRLGEAKSKPDRARLILTNRLGVCKADIDANHRFTN